jgi:peptide/nickel transport system permease protein
MLQPSPDAVTATDRATRPSAPDDGAATAAPPEAGAPDPVAPGPGGRGAPDRLAPEGSYVERRLGPLFWVCVAWLALVVGLAALAPVLPMPDPDRTGFTCARCAPLDGALLGGDSLGRDVFARLVWGARVSLTVGVLSMALGLAVGGFLGIVAGFLRGRVEAVIMGAMDALLAFPALVLLMAVVTFIAKGNAGIAHVTLSIGLLSVAPMCRLVRGSALMLGEREYVRAARMIGASRSRIIGHEIVPNIWRAPAVYSLTGVAFAIVAEGGLGFLGLSVRPPTPTWGGMISDGRLVLRESAHVALIPSAAMFLTVLALNFAGDALAAKHQLKDSAL